MNSKKQTFLNIETVCTRSEHMKKRTAITNKTQPIHRAAVVKQHEMLYTQRTFPLLTTIPGLSHIISEQNKKL